MVRNVIIIQFNDIRHITTHLYTRTYITHIHPWMYSKRQIDMSIDGQKLHRTRVRKRKTMIRLNGED